MQSLCRFRAGSLKSRAAELGVLRQDPGKPVGIKTSLRESPISGKAQLRHQERAQAKNEGLQLGRHEASGCQGADPQGKTEAESSKNEEESLQEKRPGGALIAKDDVQG